MRIVTYGCSNTYGDELRDPRNDCWGAQLGQLEGLEHIQRARCGASLDGQWLQYLDDYSTLKQDDAIIVGLPPFTRAHAWTKNIEQTLTARWLAVHQRANKQEWLDKVEQILNWFWMNHLKTLIAWSQDSRVSFQPLGMKDESKWGECEDLLSLERFSWPWLDYSVTIDCTKTQLGGHPTAEAHFKFAVDLQKAFRQRYR